MGCAGRLRSRDRRGGIQKIEKEHKEGCDTRDGGGAQGGEVSFSEPRGGLGPAGDEGRKLGQ